MTTKQISRRKSQHTIFLTTAPAAGRCAQKCPLHALVPRQGHYRIDLRFCDGCGICYDICPIGAVEKGSGPEQSM